VGASQTLHRVKGKAPPGWSGQGWRPPSHRACQARSSQLLMSSYEWHWQM
jgi:hypothetical protein